MPGPNRINILISVQNRASQPIRTARKDVRDFRDELVKFNRRLFTASAVYATFAMGFRKAFQMAEVGAQFDFFRQQFNRTFGSDYLRRLRTATRGTMDAMSMMQIALQNHARGLKQYESEKIFTLSVGAAKLLGTNTADAAKRMSRAIHSLSVTGMQQFMVALNTNNQFKNMDLLIKRLTKGLNAAGRVTANFRRVALRELGIALGEISAQTGDARSLFMQWSASFQSLRNIIGNFLARAIAPLGGALARLNWDLFDKLNMILDDTKKGFKDIRSGVIDFLQVAGGALGIGAALAGGFSLLALAASTLGISLGSVAGFLSLFAVGLKAAKGENKSWLQLLADVGTELKFYWQAFSSYRDGISTFSRDVTDRISKMSEKSQNRIMFIAKALVLVREALNGFVDGVKSAIDNMASLLEKFGIWDSKTKQFTARTAAAVKAFGFATGKVGTIGAALIGGGLLLGGITKLVGAIPKMFLNVATGGLFGRMMGRRGDSPLRPMWVAVVGGAGSVLSGAKGLAARAGGFLGGTWGFLKKSASFLGGSLKWIGALFAKLGGSVLVLKGALVAAAGALGYGVGRGINKIIEMISGKSLDNRIAEAISGDYKGAGGEALFRGMGGNVGIINRAVAGDRSIGWGGAEITAGARKKASELAEIMPQLKERGGVLNEQAIMNLVKDQELSRGDVVELIRGIKQFLEDNRPNQFVISPQQEAR